MNNYLDQLVFEAKQAIKKIDAKTIDKKFTALAHNKIAHRMRARLMMPEFHIIAEIKRRSPSKGALAPITDPVSLAKAYAAGQASAISVLTHTKGFEGNTQDLEAVTMHVPTCPVLCKDFIVDPLQIQHAMTLGADAVLLIVAVTKDKTKSLLDFCHEQKIDALVEVHTKEELRHALDLGAEIIAINNRNLKTFEVNPFHALTLKPLIPKGILTIAASGICDEKIAAAYRQANFTGLLIGEALVTSKEPTQLIQRFKHD